MQLNSLYYNIKKVFLPITAIFSSIIFILILGLGFLGWVVWSIDGDRYDDSINILSNYYLNTDYQAIGKKIDDSGYKFVIENVDSVGIQRNLIYGFAGERYFMFNTSTERVVYFQSKDSLGLIAVPDLQAIKEYKKR